MDYVYVFRKGDIELFYSNYNCLKNLDDSELLEKYNREARLGIIGVHAQALKLLALRKVFLNRYGKSPIGFEDDIVITLEGIIDSSFFTS